jgi:hypothetical protein
MLRAEIAFYVACLNLNDRLASKGEPTTFPVIAPRDQVGLTASFAATNEREGSQIARHVVDALLAEHVKVVFVTHMFDLARSFYEQKREPALFLRAARGSGGARPFRLSEGKPLPTSYGEDSYRKIVGRRVGTATIATAVAAVAALLRARSASWVVSEGSVPSTRRRATRFYPTAISAQASSSTRVGRRPPTAGHRQSDRRRASCPGRA